MSDIEIDIPEYAGTILLTADNEIVLQLRDDNPAIVDPNCLSLFAGKMEKGETPDQAVRRTLYEETTLRPKAFRYLFTFQTDKIRHGRIVKSHVYLVRSVVAADIDVHQGQGYRIIRTAADLELHDFALISKDILRKYFDNNF